MAGKRCPACGAAVAPRLEGAHLRCPACGHAAPVRTIRATRVLAPLRPRARPRTGGAGLATVFVVLLLLAAGVLVAVAFAPSDSSLGSLAHLVPGVHGGRTEDGASRPLAPPADADGIYHREYRWDYGGDEWSFKLAIPQEAYNGFHNGPRPSRLVDKDGTLYREMAYDVFVSTPLDDAYINDLGSKLHDAAQRKGWSDDETLSFALSFVQSMPYTADDVTTGKDEYPRYPLETLVDNGGDCEDSAILYASLVQALGYGVVLVSPPGHMAVGVKATDVSGGVSYTYPPGSDDHYLYAETTGDGWSIGEAPPEYAGQTAQIFTLEPKPLFTLDVDYSSEIVGGFQDLWLNATNLGSAAASDVSLMADLTSSSGVLSYDRVSCHVAAVAPGTSSHCELRVDLRKVPRGQEVVIRSTVQDAQFTYARQDSAPWEPH